MSSRILAAFATAAIATLAPSPVAAQAPEDAVVLDVEDVRFDELVPGVEFGAVYGVYTEEAHGKVVRFKPGMISPMHTHTNAYHGVVIEGTVINPYEGEDEPVELGPGDYWHVPAGAPHKTGCVSEEPCLFYTHGDAKWDIQILEGEAAPSR